MEVNVAASFSNQGDEAVQRHLDVRNVRIDQENFDNFFEMSSVVKFIQANGYKRIALQFPDEYLNYSTSVAMQLESSLGFKPYILADTSYGSCCVDEVAAQHVTADCIIHYGDACMSKVQGRVPIRYVLPKDDLNISDFNSKLNDLKNQLPLLFDYSQLKIVLDFNYLHLKDAVRNEVQSVFDEKCELLFESDYSIDFDKNYCILFVGRSAISIRLTLLMMINPEVKFFSYDPTILLMRPESVDVNRILKKRYFLIEKVKDANVIGIVVGTLSIASYLSVLDRLKELCKSTGKKYYVFSVGKLNVAKLSNFAEVDVFVLLSCPYNIMLDWSSYYRPIVTPFEIEIAFNSSKSWMAGTGWTPDYSTLLGTQIESAASANLADTDMSLITGKLRNMNPVLDEKSSSALINRADALEVQIFGTQDCFKNRSWRGLEEKLGETDVGTVKEGKSGIASAYENETS